MHIKHLRPICFFQTESYSAAGLKLTSSSSVSELVTRGSYDSQEYVLGLGAETGFDYQRFRFLPMRLNFSETNFLFFFLFWC